MPPVFTTSSFAKKIDLVEISWNLLDKKIKNKYTETKCVNYNIPKIGLSRRQLGIPNPLSQWSLSSYIVNNWLTINKNLISNSSASIPKYTTYGERAIRTQLSYGEFRRAGVLDSYGKIYEIKTDIAKYYGSIYTHSIPWVMHTKAIAKARRNDYTLEGNNIDRLLRNCQSGQTIGIPVGPDTSLIISELIGCWIDNEFAAKLPGYVGYRYVDDFNFFFTSLELAEKAVRVLQEIFTSINLDMNDSKTQIKRSPHFFDNGWSYVLSNYSFATDDKKQKNDIIRFFDMSFKYAIEFPADSVLKYAMKVLNRIDVNPSNWQLYESMLMKTVITEPATLQDFSKIMYQQKSRVTVSRITEVVYLLLHEHVYKAHSFEIGWALWLANLFSIKIEDVTANKLFLLNDAATLVQSLHLKSNSLISHTADSRPVEDYIDEVSLESEYWLLCYEAIRHNWVPPTFNKIVDTHPFFSLLKKNGVTFFHPTRVPSGFLPKKKLKASPPAVTKTAGDSENIKFISY